MKLQKIILAAALGACSISAFADWQPYVGAGLGVTNGRFATNINSPTSLSIAGITDSNTAPYHYSKTNNMATPEIQFGVANQYNKFYLGLGASLQYNNSTYNSNNISNTLTNGGGAVIGNFKYNTVSTLQWNTSLTTQLGYFVTQNFMPYAKIGITAAEGSVTQNINNEPGSTNPTGLVASTHANPWMFGPTTSLGAQYTLTQHLRVFSEVNFTYLWGSANPAVDLTQNGQTNFAPNLHASSKQTYTYSSWTFQVGTNYYF